MEKKGNILAIDDELSILNSYKIILGSDYNFYSAETGEKGIEIFLKNNIDIILLDIMLTGKNGIEILKEIKELDPFVEIIMISALDNLDTAVDAMKLGAYDYLTKPFNHVKLINLIENILKIKQLTKQNTYMKDKLDKMEPSDKIIGEDEKIQNIFNMISDIADSEGTILITGESGTGKEIVARAIHRLGNRKDNPFVVINCAAIPKALMESEIFGHKKGAFTGAFSSQIGKLELADGGIVFFDDIDTLDIEMQAKLLRVIQEKEFERIGSSKVNSINVRFIASSNKNLLKLIEQGKFREDLYYRLNLFPIDLPPLRERRKDIPLLIDHFVEQYSKTHGGRVITISKKVKQILVELYDWPGNVRELKNIIERLLTITKGNVIYPANLDRINMRHKEISNLPLDEAKKIFEKEYISKILTTTNGNRKEAARILGIHRNTLLSKMRAY